MTREEFEAEFNSRTLAFHPDYRSDDRAVLVAFDPSADSAPGHALMMSLVNQLARAHRRLTLVGDLDRELRCADVFGFGTLKNATVGLARAINPFIEVDVRPRPTLDERLLLSIGVGTSDCDLALGANGWLALLGSGATIRDDATTMLGAGLAACLGASVAFHRAIGHDEVPAGPFSLWTFGGAGMDQGPHLLGPVDVGRVLQVGAGAVGCALDWWLRLVGFEGVWTIVDGDLVDVSNLNRQLLFLARDAGYPVGPARNKAGAVGERLGAGARPSPEWWGKDAGVAGDAYDLILPLANEAGVRQQLQAKAATVLLHATTSPWWQAQAHRHVAGHDDCISCRLPDEATGFDCATGIVGESKRADASLPFLAAAAGLLLLAQILRLQTGTLLDDRANLHALDLSQPVPSTHRKVWRCRDGCRSRLPEAARLQLTLGHKYAHLDGARMKQTG